MKKKIDNPMKRMGFDKDLKGRWKLKIPLLNSSIIVREDFEGRWRATFRNNIGGKVTSSRLKDEPQHAAHELMVELASPLMTIIESAHLESWNEHVREATALSREIDN